MSRTRSSTRGHAARDEAAAQRLGRKGDGQVSSHPRLLGIYLNDHLAGATGGLALSRRLAAAERDGLAGGGDDGTALDRIAAEIEQDREDLLDIMSALEVPVSRYKTLAAWLAEKVGRLKFNGRVRRRSPLSGLLELEALWLGVHGKIAGWVVLRALAAHDDRLDSRRLDELITRARHQATTLEELRSRAAAEILGHPVPAMAR